MWAFTVLPLAIVLCIKVFSIDDSTFELRLASLFFNLIGVIGTVFQVQIKPDDRTTWFSNQFFKLHKSISGSAEWSVKQNRENFVEITEVQTDTIVAVIRQEAHTDEFHERLNIILNTVIRKRLTDTSQRLDKIALSLDMSEVPDATVTSQLYALRSFEDEDNSPVQQSEYTFEAGFEAFHRKVLLLGKAGAGKTTTLAQFAEKIFLNRLNNTKAKLPIYTPISKWRGKKPLIKWILQEADLPPKAIEQIYSGNAILLLDGLDELPTIFEGGKRDLQDEFVKCLNDELDANDLVITSRENDYENLMRKGGKVFAGGALVIQPLNNAQIESYLQSFPELWGVLKSDARLLEMMRTPLLLRIFTIAYKGLEGDARQLALTKSGDGDLRDRLFNAYVRKRHFHEQQKSPRNFPTIDRIYEVLGPIAAEDRPDKSEYLARILGDQAEEFIQQMCNMHILVQSPKSGVTFIHLLLEYHFAWNSLIESLEGKGKISKLKVIYRLGEIRDKRATGYLISIIEQEHGFEQEMAATALGKIADPNSIPALLTALQHEKGGVREAIIRALGSIKDVRTIVPLIGAFGDGDLGHIASRSVEQFGNLAVNELLKALEDNRIKVRAEAAWILARLQTEQAVQPLINALSRAKERIEVPYPAFVGGYVDPTYTTLRVDTRFLEFVRVDDDIAAFLGALAYLGKPSIDMLVDLFLNSEDPIKEAAMWSLARIEDRHLTDLFIEALEEDNDKIRTYAVYGLAKNCGLSLEKDYRAVPYIIKTIQQRPITENLFVCAIWALGVIGDPYGVDIVLAYLREFSSKHSRAKYHAIGGLGLSKSKKAVPILISFLNDPGDHVGEYAAEALGRINDIQAVEPLIASLKDAEGNVRRNVVEALGEIGDKRAVRPLMQNFGESQFIPIALNKIKDKSIIPELQQIAKTETRHHVHVAALKLIQELQSLPD